MIRTNDKQRDHDTTRVLGIDYANLDYDGVVEKTAQWVDRRESRYVAVAPVSNLMLAHTSAAHRESLREADLITADGVPVVWTQRMLGHTDATRVYGPTLMLKVLERAEKEGWQVGFYGGHPDRNPEMLKNLQEMYPNLRIAGCWSPPFRALTDDELADYRRSMLDAGVQVLMVGIGCPKQERWMHENVGGLNTVMFGVGAAFDFHAGAVRQAPAFLQRAGLEWAFRLCMEPRRLWKRYLTTVPPFMLAAARQVLGARLTKRSYQVPQGSTS